MAMSTGLSCADWKKDRSLALRVRPTGLARDINRYLNDETVEASPPRVSYRLGKFLRRHKRPMLAAGLVFLVLALGLATTARSFVMVQRERMAAEQAAMEAQRSRVSEAVQAEDRMEQALGIMDKVLDERQTVLAVQAFLRRDLLRQANAYDKTVEFFLRSTCIARLVQLYHTWGQAGKRLPSCGITCRNQVEN